MLYRKSFEGYEVLIVHPGGPFWAKKDNGAWSLPKGEYAEGEKPLAAAKREFAEETGVSAPDGEYLDLGQQKLSSGKVVHAFALESDFDLEKFASNMFEMEWPPRSGKKQEFPEADKAAWLPLATAKQKLNQGQAPFIDILASKLGIKLGGASGSEKPPQISLL